MAKSEKFYKQLVGSNIQALRYSEDLTLRDVAVNTSLSTSWLSVIEASRVLPSLKTLIKLSNFYDVPVHYFFIKNSEPAGSADRFA